MANPVFTYSAFAKAVAEAVGNNMKVKDLYHARLTAAGDDAAKVAEIRSEFIVAYTARSLHKAVNAKVFGEVATLYALPRHGTKGDGAKQTEAETLAFASAIRAFNRLREDSGAVAANATGRKRGSKLNVTKPGDAKDGEIVSPPVKSAPVHDTESMLALLAQTRVTLSGLMKNNAARITGDRGELVRDAVTAICAIIARLPQAESKDKAA
jgi:hypothetical protein